MTAAAQVVEDPPAPLRAVLERRFPRVAAALDEERAWRWARAWAARAVPGAEVGAVQVGWLLLRPDGSCSLRYLLHLLPSGRRQLLLVEVPSSSGITVRPFPADPRLPTLRPATDPVLMREVLGRVVPGTGGERGVTRCRVEVVHYPRQARCVLRYRLSPGAGGAAELRHPVVFGKVHGDSTASAAAAAAGRLLRDGVRQLPHDLRIEVPRPLAVVAPLRLSLAEELPARSLLPELVPAACTPGTGPDGPRQESQREAIRRAARLAVTVHLCPGAEADLPVRDLAGERAATERELASLEDLWPEVAGRLRRSVTRALEAVEEDGGGLDPAGWPAGAGLAHGDLTPGQVLLGASGRTGLVDVDTLCLAEPALDLGRFLAYLHVAAALRSPGAPPPWQELTEPFLDGYLEARPLPDPGRLRIRTDAYRALALARLGASACRQLKDHRLSAVVDALDATTSARGTERT